MWFTAGQPPNERWLSGSLSDRPYGDNTFRPFFGGSVPAYREVIWAEIHLKFRPDLSFGDNDNKRIRPRKVGRAACIVCCIVTFYLLCT